MQNAFLSSTLTLAGLIVMVHRGGDHYHTELVWVAIGVYVIWNAFWMLLGTYCSLPDEINHRVSDLTSNAVLPEILPRDGTCLEFVETETLCVICISRPAPPYVFRTQCGHNFCPHCIQLWLQASNTCPVCRAPVSLHATECPGCSGDAASLQSVLIEI